MKKRVIYLLPSFIFLFSSFSLIIDRNNALTIKCEKKLLVDEDNLKIKVSYLNNSSDTIILPLNYLYYNNFQKVEFDSSHKIFCSRSVKMSFPNGKDANCNYKKLVKNGFKIINPHQEVSIEYTLDELGCVNYKLTKGEEVYYFITIDIDYRFKNWCDNVWTGKIKSDYGSFKIK